MRNLLERYLPMRDAAGDGGGGGAGAGGQGANAGAGAGAAAAAGDGSNGVAAAAGQPYRPQGLPDTMFGKDDRETMDKMATALAGYRTRDSERAVPDNVDAYAQFDAASAPDFLKGHLPSLAKDPAFAAAAAVAKENGVPVKTMHAMTTALYQAAHEAGILEPPVNTEAERAALLPETHKNSPKAEQDAAIEARLQANEDFIKLLTKPGADGKSQLDPKVGENALLMLMDTAAGNQFLEFVRGMATGDGRAQPLTQGAGAGAGNNEREQLRAELARPEMDPQHPKFDPAAYAALDERYKKLIGN